MALGTILNTEAHFDTPKNTSSSIKSLLQATQVPIKLLNIPDSYLIDACEFMNAIYEDMSQINELISIHKQQALVPEGFCLFYKGFLVVNSLEPRYLSKVV